MRDGVPVRCAFRSHDGRDAGKDSGTTTRTLDYPFGAKAYLPLSLAFSTRIAHVAVVPSRGHSDACEIDGINESNRSQNSGGRNVDARCPNGTGYRAREPISGGGRETGNRRILFGLRHELDDGLDQ